MSDTITVSAPGAKPGAVAVIVTTLFPSETPSVTVLITKLFVVWPAGRVTVAGTLASFVLPEVSVTTRAAVGLSLRETVASVALGKPSATSFCVIWRVSAGTSSSVMVNVAAAPVVTRVLEPVASTCGVTTAVLVPSIKALFSTATGTLAEAWFAGMVSVAGSSAAAELLFCNSTTRSRPLTKLRVTVASAACEPAPSLTVAGEKESVTAGISLSRMVTLVTPGRWPPALAVTDSVVIGSTKSSSTARATKLTELVPPGIVTTSGRNN